MRKTKFKYNIGDVVNGLMITEQASVQTKHGKKKAYKATCLVCGYDCGEYYKAGQYHKDHYIMENNLSRGVGCSVCSNNGFVVSNINSIHVRAPWMEEYLLNKDDALKYAPHSTVKVNCKCPECGRDRKIGLSHMYYYGFSCVCGDGFSYPEKFIYNCLTQLKINFKTQFKFNNANYRYDFFLKQYNIIIEVHGSQHYIQKWERNEVENDKNKKEFALYSGILEENYIVLDCRKSKPEFIWQSLIKSKLKDLFDLNSIDISQCSEYANNNFVKIASDLWNDGDSLETIANKMQLYYVIFKKRK